MNKKNLLVVIGIIIGCLVAITIYTLIIIRDTEEFKCAEEYLHENWGQFDLTKDSFEIGIVGISIETQYNLDKDKGNSQVILPIKTKDGNTLKIYFELMKENRKWRVLKVEQL